MKNRLLIFGATIFICSIGFFAGVLNAKAETQWQSVGLSGFTDGSVDKTISIAINPQDNDPYVVFRDGSRSSKITVMKYNGSAWVNVGSPGFSNGEVNTLSAAFDNSGTLYIAFGDKFSGQNRLVVKKFNGSSWENVGSSFNDVDVEEVFLAINPSTQKPYVAFDDMGYNLGYVKLAVAKFNGSSWEYVGNTGYTFGSSLNLVFNPANSYPYLSFASGGGALMTQIFVLKFNGSDWISAGSSSNNAISGYQSLRPSLAFEPDTNIPYVAYSEGSDLNYTINVKKLVGSTWVSVGNERFSPDAVTSISLSFSPITNEPFVSFHAIPEEGGYSGPIVMKFNGSGWVYVGGYSVGSSTNSAWPFSNPITFRPGTNAAYVAYADFHNSNKLTVRKFGSSNQGITEDSCSGNKCKVYRFWSNQKQGHFFTKTKTEANGIIAYDPSWSYEGVAYYSFDSQESNTTPIYRFWSNSKQHHFFTASATEKDSIIANDHSWSYEGIAYYAYASQQSNTTPVYRFWSQAKQGHFFTISETEKNNIIANDSSWSYEGIAWHVPTN